MCGIAAIVGVERDPPAGAVERMVRALAHRGPDGSGTLALPHCRLGHTRLSIIDVVGGVQPMTDPSGRYSVVFNGEIYNFRELRRDLERRGAQFRTQSDTEVLLLAYREFGTEAVGRLHGQFAFAVWDRDENRLFAARDRLGEKPLFYAEPPNGPFLLASELRALLASKLVEPTLDLDAIDAYLQLLYVPPDRSVYSNIHVLPPGHALTWTRGRLIQWRYWQPRLSTARIDPEEAVVQTRTLVEQAVRRQMVADVPVGAFLSGGLDSSTVVALMSGTTDRPIRTFAVGFGDVIDELPFARTVAERYRTDHVELQMDAAVGDLLEEMASVYDEPLADSSNIPTYLVSRLARKHVTVALSGDGGDELFGGYTWYSQLQEDEVLPAGAWNFAAARARQLFWGGMRRLRLAGTQAGRADAERFRKIGRKRRYPDLWRRHLANCTLDWPASAKAGGGTPWAEGYRPDESVRGIDRAVAFDLQCYLPGDILVKVDRASMAHGLETRAPFLDVPLVEFVLSLPTALRFPGGPLKVLLRRACEHLWPEAIRRRGKQGFGGPVSAWVQRPDFQALARRVARPGGPLIDLFPDVGAWWDRLAPQHCWSLVVLGLWLEKHPVRQALRRQAA